MKSDLANLLMVSDIDGTLLIDGVIPEDDIQTISEFTSRGGKFTLATGRSVQSAGYYIEQAGVNCPAITCNGAIIYDFQKNTILWQTSLPESAKKLVAPVMERFPEIGAEVHCGKDLYIFNWSKETEKHVKYEELDYFDSTVSQTLDLNWTKVLYAGRPELIDELVKFVQTLPNSDCYYLRTDKHYLELTPIAANKGLALHHLADLLNISHENTCAIGDFYNDIDLIKAAGIGAFVANAPDELKPLADYIAKSGKDGGVADFIRHVIKGRN